MAKMCSKCKQMNDDDMYFCIYCSHPFDSKVQLIMELDQREKDKKAKAAMNQARRPQEDHDYVPPKRKPKKKESSGGCLWVVLGIVAVAAVVWAVFLR